ncbi:MAG TPA: hypothetical protein VKB18_10460 [Gemmatimonadota bacterium]|nr:hypothetical protein [Gemmatimonadota bacterium]
MDVVRWSAASLLGGGAAALLLAPAPARLRAQDTTSAEPTRRLPPSSIREALGHRALGPSCVPTEFIIGDSAGADAATIRGALRRAQDDDACSVRLRLAPGEHRGSFRVDRDTEILGPTGGRASVHGTVSVRGPHTLRIRSVHLRHAGRPGALIVADRGARVVLTTLTISGAAGYGIRQRGGELLLDRVNVFGTRALSAFSGSGVGIALSDGARVRLRGVTLAGNEAQALVASGPDTRVRARRLLVVNTGHRARSPLADDDVHGVGAVEVRRGAAMLASRLRMSDSEGVGIQVHDGGRLHVRGGLVRGTRKTDRESGVNVAVVDGTAELHDVTLSGADLAGLLVARGGTVSLAGSTVSRNAVGVALRSDVPLECLRRRVVYRDNGVNLDASGPTLPETDLPPADGGERASDRAVCARVPWR